MDDLSVRDITQLYLNCLVMYKNSPVFVHRVMDNREVVIAKLEDGSVHTVKFKLDDFKSLNSRLGFVNTGVGCAYLKRRPVRRYQVGISNENMSVDVMYTEYDAAIKIEVGGLKTSAIMHTIQGDFPSLQDAWEAALSLNSCFAFDRQFAVRYDGRIYYRGRLHVGYLSIHAEEELTVKSIRFAPEYEHLITLLDGSYGKSL